MNHLSQMEITITAGDALLALAAAAAVGMVVTLVGLYGKLSDVVQGNRYLAAFWRESQQWLVSRGYSTADIGGEHPPTVGWLGRAIRMAAEPLVWLRWPRSHAGYSGRHRLAGGAA